jgi:hypothetical protein
VDVSLAQLKEQLYAMRSWDSSGQTQDTRIRRALNVALNRMSNDVPEALLPDEEHIVLYPDVKSSDSTVSAKVISLDSDKRLLEFIDTAGTKIADASSLTSWRPTVTGEWDGIMHIEITDSSGQIHRRQCLEWFKDTDDGTVTYGVTLDRPYNELITVNNQGVGSLDFRIHQPEFFVADDVIEVMEPATLFDGSRQQVWKLDTAGASRQDMLDYQGNSTGKPYRCWRGRHFQLPAPTEAPRIMEANGTTTTQRERGLDDQGNAVIVDKEIYSPIASAFKWEDNLSLRRGTWAICYTYVLGRRDEDWQQSPLVTPGGDTEQDSSYGLTWAYKKGSVLSGENQYSGIHDPQFESAPSPVTVINQSSDKGEPGAMIISASNIDAMLGFGDSTHKRYGRTGLRIRYYVAQLDADSKGVGKFNDVETNRRFHLLCEVEPTFDMVTTITATGVTLPDALAKLGSSESKAARIVWSGKELYDYHRTLKHSTGYYAWKVFPHQDSRYEVDFRVSRLPRPFVTDADTAPIHPESIPTLLELALYYVSLSDGNDQVGAQAHLARYQDLLRVFRDRYANSGRVVEPVPILGYAHRHRYGTFSSS